MVLDGRPFGAAGAYEKLAGILRFAVDPAHPANQSVTDLGLAPQNASGLVESWADFYLRSEEHTSELQSLAYLVCRLLLEKKKKIILMGADRHSFAGYRIDDQIDNGQILDPSTSTPLFRDVPHYTTFTLVPAARVSWYASH